MKITGIIAEYNPLHKGHEYQLQKAKSITESDYCIVLMSGNYVQRGAPALFDKYLRTKMALTAGADLVLELPSAYSCASAEFFAQGGIKILNGLNSVDTLCFGSESGDITSLNNIAAMTLDESSPLQNEIQQNLKKGLSYPKARYDALLKHCSDQKLTHQLPAIMTSPNNLLGIEYCKALLKQNSTMIPITIKRIGSSYHDTSLNSDYTSASSLRALYKEQDWKATEAYIPHNIYTLLEQESDSLYPLETNDFSLILHAKLLNLYFSHENLTSYFDITKDLSDKILKHLVNFKNIESFSETLKSKDITNTRIHRSLFHILLNHTKDSLLPFYHPNFQGYARILGFRKNSSDLLSYIKKRTNIPLISKPAKAKSILGENSLEYSLFQNETYASLLYNAVKTNKYGVSTKHEYTNSSIPYEII